jgi:hypothetical protein
VRNGEPIKIGRFTSRRPGRRHPVRLTIDLPGDNYQLEVHNLDAATTTTRMQAARGVLDLGVTTDDFVLVWHRG